MARSPLADASTILAGLERIVQEYRRPASWDTVGPMLLNEAAGKLSDVRQILHALAELEATAHSHATGCAWAGEGYHAE